MPARPDISPVCYSDINYKSASSNPGSGLLGTIDTDRPSKTLDRLGLLVRWTVRTSSPGIWGRTIGSPVRVGVTC